MNWTETRNKLMEYGVQADNLPEDWRRGIDLSGANLSEASLSGADLYGADLNGANLSEANLSEASLSGADLYGADLNGANLSRADLYGADLYGADLNGASLSGADLYGADLSEASLSGADLYGADLSRADLSGANLSGAIDIYSFAFGRHFAFFQPSSGYLKIGCIGNPLDWWLENYEAVGKKEDYSKADIGRYGDMIKLLAGWQKQTEELEEPNQ